MVGTIFFQFSGILRDNDNNSPICNASSEENGMELANILSEWLIIPRKGGGGGKDPGELKKTKHFLGKHAPYPPPTFPLEACALGDHLGNRLVFILHPHWDTLTNYKAHGAVSTKFMDFNFFSLVSPNRCSSALKESFYNLQYSECKENLKF